MLAAYLVVADYLNGVGSICIDPTGTLTNYVLNRLRYAGRRDVWDKVIYIPMLGMEVRGEPWLIPTPFLYDASGHDSFQQQTARVVNFFERLYPNQENAPVQGMPAIRRNVRYAGMLLAAMGKQLVPDSTDLIDAMGTSSKHATPWAAAIAEVAERYPILRRPAHYFLKIYPTHRDQAGQTSTYMGAVDPFALDDRLAAQYGANHWGVDIRAVEDGHLIIFDCSQLEEADIKPAVMWLFTHCTEYLRKRGYRRDVIGFVIDELFWLANERNGLIEDDIRKMIVVYGRNYGIAPFFTYQSVTQLSIGMQKALYELGYHFFAGASDPDAAEALARFLHDFDEEWIKSEEPIYWPGGWRTVGSDEPYYTETRKSLYTPQEQHAIHASRYRRIPGLTAAVARSAKEGNTSRFVGQYSLEEIRDSQNFDFTGIEKTKALLLKRHGRKLSDIITEIEARRPAPVMEERPTFGEPPPSVSMR